MSWEQLVDIAREAAAERAAEAARGPVACPNDGEPLEERNGVRHCPWGDYQYP